MRTATVKRDTEETKVVISLSLDGTGQTAVSTGIPFFDHMLSLMGFHGKFDLEVDATGDLEVDDHHTVEDVGIVFGQALDQALGEDRGIARYASALLPMDEVLVRVVLDFSGRAYLHLDEQFRREQVGTLSTENVREFFRAVTREARVTMHLDVLHGGNDHHQIEAIFKGFGRALSEAVRPDADRDVTSTKGTL